MVEEISISEFKEIPYYIALCHHCFRVISLPFKPEDGLEVGCQNCGKTYIISED